MLVFLKEPMAYTTIDGYRIYGRKYSYGSFGSTDIPFDTYKKHRSIFEDAEYTEEWLESKFNKKFPPISFTIKELSKMGFTRIISIARLMGINYIWDGKRKPTVSERHAIRKSIISFLN